MLLNKIKINVLLTILTWASFTGCKKLIKIDEPKTQIVSERVFESNESAIGTISNIYAQLNNGVSINGNLTPFLGLYTDELTGNGLTGSNLEFQSSSVPTTNTTNLNLWKGFYSVIYQCNALLEGVAKSGGITPAVKNQLTGEAKFLRAFSYFYLVNLYGDVPLLTTTDVYINSSAGRMPKQEVYKQIENDLQEAKTLLKEEYPSPDRARANYWAAVALLARVYLYELKWGSAGEEASSLISSGLYPLESIENVFDNASSETILQAWTPTGYTSQGAVLNAKTGTPRYFLSQSLLHSFDSSDLRKEDWTRTVAVGSNKYTVSAKYKNSSSTTGSEAEFLIVLRSAEQYLIRAESRAEQNNVNDAIADLNRIRNRAGLEAIELPLTKDSCLLLIQEERRREFFTEWAHRLLDLKRWDQLQDIMVAYKYTWTSKAVNLPIPQNEINRNQSLVQNPGY